MTRQINSVVKPTVPTIGNCASAQTSASTSSTQRVGTRLTMNPTTTAAIENRKKKDEPSRPNCSGSSFNSVMIGTPARPTTILSAKFTSMNKNSRNVIRHAPFGVGCAAMIDPPEVAFFLLCSPVTKAATMLLVASAQMQSDILAPGLRSSGRTNMLDCNMRML